MAAIIVTLLLLAWAASAFTALPDRLDFSKLFIWRLKLPTWLPRPPIIILGLILSMVGFGVRYHFRDQNETNSWFWIFIIDLAPEIVGMAFTLIIIDSFNQWWQEQQEKQRVIQQIGSQSNDAAIEAIRLAKNYQLLQNGALVEIDLRGANLAKANLIQANLRGVRLDGAILEGAMLSRAMLKGANLCNANLRKTRLDEADLEEANLQFAQLQNSSLAGANLKNANLIFANLRSAELLLADLESAKLYNARLKQANIEQTCLQGAILIGADLEDANLLSAKLQGALYDDTTKWPAGFVAETAGAIKVKRYSKVHPDLTVSSWWIPDNPNVAYFEIKI